MKENQFKINEISLAILLFWCGLIVVASNYITIPLMSAFTQQFHVSAEQTAWLGTSFSFAYALSCLLVGVLSDRFGRKRIMVGGLILLSVITLIIPFGNQLSWLIMGRIMQGIAASSFAPVAVVYISEKFSKEIKGTVVGLVSASFLISAIVGQIMSAYISRLLNWQAVFCTFGIIYLLTALILYSYASPVSNQSKGILFSQLFRHYWEVLRKKNLIKLYLIALTLLFAFVAFYTVLEGYSVHTFHLSKDNIFKIRALGMIGMLFAPFADKLARKFDIKCLLILSLLFSLVSLFIITFCPYLNVLIIMSLLFVAGISIIVPTLIILVGRFGQNQAGIAVSFYTFILFLGASFGSIAGVQLLTVLGAKATFLTLALLLLFSMLVAFTLDIKGEQ
ncbi:TPA: MFS transporter [Streptococcus mutans]|nr:MFS transporter [Streptococcus mutans]